MYTVEIISDNAYDFSRAKRGAFALHDAITTAADPTKISLVSGEIEMFIPEGEDVEFERDLTITLAFNANPDCALSVNDVYTLLHETLTGFELSDVTITTPFSPDEGTERIVLLTSGQEYRIEGLACDVFGASVLDAYLHNNNWGARGYVHQWAHNDPKWAAVLQAYLAAEDPLDQQACMQTLKSEFPNDDSLFYGQIGLMGHVVHISQIEG